jgi:protein involved in polysaccharide export with SLBB domain
VDQVVLYRTADRSAVIGRELSRTDAASFAIAGGDIVMVPAAGSLLRPLGRQAVLVRLEGEVERPGNYFVSPGTRLGDVLREAGGLTSEAFVFGTRFERASVKVQQKGAFVEAINQLELTLASAPLTSSGLNPGEESRQLAAAQAVLARLREAEPDGRLVLDLRPESRTLPEDVLLENSDRIVVPPRPSAVGVFGAVYQPASFLIQSNGSQIADYLDRAGGPLRSADRGRLFVIRANGEIITRNKGALQARAVPGDVVFMPVKAQGASLLAKLRDISTIVFQIGITGAAVAAILR